MSLTVAALALSALMLGANADVSDERAAIQERLEAEKNAFETLTAERKSLLTLLDTLEKLARDSGTRSLALERTLARIDQQLKDARAAEAMMHLEVLAQEHKLGPRLATLYRLQKRDALGFLLSASDFATLIKRQRAIKTLVRRDVEALDDLALLSRSQRLAVRRSERLENSAQQYLKALRLEQAVGRARVARFNELLLSVKAEQNSRSRVIAELEASERELTAMVNDLASSTGFTGFRARKGHLPFPTAGSVEVGYGKVVNPRFNTVTVQKGIDIRAPLGSKVSSAGAGTVVFSGWLKGYGNLVIVDHGGNYHSLYAHLANSLVEAGNEVEEGEQLGQVGDTGSLKGAYLYFEIRKQGQAVDPQPWLTSDENESP